MQTTYNRTILKPQIVNFLAFASNNFEPKRPRHRVDAFEFSATIDSKKSHPLGRMIHKISYKLCWLIF